MKCGVTAWKFKKRAKLTADGFNTKDFTYVSISDVIRVAYTFTTIFTINHI